MLLTCVSSVSFYKFEIKELIWSFLGHDGSNMKALQLTMKEFMKLIPPNPIFGLNPVFVRPSDTLRMVR